MPRANPTPWGYWLFVASRLGIGPASFWRLSLREWRLLAGPGNPAAMTREAFQQLAARFPDDIT